MDNKSIKTNKIIEIMLSEGNIAKTMSDTFNKEQIKKIKAVSKKIGEIDKDKDANLKKIYLVDGSSVRINANIKSKWISLEGMQRGIDTLYSNFPDDITGTFDSKISHKENFFKFIENNGINLYLKLMLNKITEISKIVIFNKDISDAKILEMNAFETNFDEIDFEEDILNNKDLSTWFIKVNGINLFQVQAPSSAKRPNSHILRFNVEYLEKLLKSINDNSETLGISAEVALCNFYKIKVPAEYVGRSNQNMVDRVLAAYTEYESNCDIPKFTSIEATKRDGAKKSPIDFRAGQKTISVKTNMSLRGKVCPPEKGQPGFEQGTQIYNDFFETNFTFAQFKRNDFEVFKEHFVKNICKIVNDQLSFLFSEDYLLYIKDAKKGPEIYWLETKNYEFKFEDTFEFTRTGSDWNESTSIGYVINGNRIPIAEMQIHKERAPFKFRFNMPNLIKLIENDQRN